MRRTRQELHENHWKGHRFKERMTVAGWRQILLRHEDVITFEGRRTQLVAKSLGCGVVEVGKVVRKP